MSINHLNIQNKQTGDKLSATEFNSTTSKINEVVDGVNASATGGKIGSNGEPLTKDSNGRIIIPLATSSSSGAMSASDKSKLDSINPSGGTGDYVDSISNEANYTASDMYDTTSEFYGTNHKINTRSISYTTSDGSTHTFTHLDTVYKVATPSTTAGGATISGKAGLMSAQDKQKLDMMPRPSDITSALSGKADKQIVVLVTRTQQGSTYVYSASKTFTEISTAIGNGTNVILQYDGNYYHLSYSTRDYIVFTRFIDDAYMYSSIEVNSHDEWSYSSFILQEELTIDSTPTNGSSNPVSSGGVYNALRSNFKTVNGEQLQGSGNVQTQQLVHFLETNGEWTCEWVLEDMISAFNAGVSLRGVIELSGNSYFSEVTESRDNFMRFTWIIPSESGTAPYSIYNQILLVLEAQEISTGDDMVTTVIYQRFNKPILTPTDLRAVAFSGSYSDLSDTPTFKTINGNSIVGSGSVTIDTSMIPYVSQDSHADFQGYVLDEVLNYLDDYKQATLTFDSTPTSGSTNPVTSGGVFSALRYDGNSTNYVASDDSFEDCIESLDSELANKQDTLVSGTNIKTVNNITLLGSGNIDAKELVYGKIQGTSFYSAIRNPRSGNWTFSANAETPNEQKIYIDILTNIIYKYDADVGYVQIGGGQIKTINGQSLIGSGNVTLDTELINYDGDGNTYFAAGDSLTEGLDSMADAIDNINPNEISSITATESTASGGNNVVTITQTNGTTTSFNVKNGIDGVDGQDGADGVSLGEVALVQATGDSEESVMSQKAVTEYGRKVTTEDLGGTSNWIKNELTAAGWELGVIMNGNGATIASASYCVTPYLEVSGIEGHSINISGGFALTTACTVWFNEDKTKLIYVAQNANPRTITLGTYSTPVAYIRFTCGLTSIADSYIYDNTTEKYIFKGNEYLATLCDGNIDFRLFLEKLLIQETGDNNFKIMSQKAISEELQTTGYFNKPTYLQGRLCYFSLADYPDLDLRTADGISIVFTTNSKDNEKTPMFDIWNPNNGLNNGMANRHFGLWNWDRNINFGFFGSYGGITTGGYSFSRVKGHYVITYDFKTGICKCYKNGVLVTTGSPTTWDEQTMVRDYFNTCTHIHLCSLDDSFGHKSTGIAVYGSVLTDEDVVFIYGGGKESIKSILTPEIYKANYAHPILTTNWGIRITNGTATPITSGGYTINATSSSDYIRFGFNGLEGLINNLIYEWDFEVTSGSSTHNSAVSYSRAMRISGSYYKCFVIYDSNGNDVTFSTLGVGNYHVVSRPDNIKAGGINTDYYVYPYVYLEYFFLCSSDFSMTILPTLKLTERGTAIECSIRNYRGTHWELPGGIKLPLNNFNIYETSKFILGTDTFVEDTVIYAANNPPQFNGQMAVDSTNGKVYVGYLTSTGGTWKQINNS